jgi:LPS export ABC transporter protein LptC
MGKKITAIVIVVFVCWGLGIFVFQKTGKKVIANKPKSKRPHIILEGFLLQKFKGTEQTLALSAKKAVYLSSNEIALSGGVNLVRYNRGASEQVYSQKALVKLFKSKDSGSFEELEVEKVFLKESVNFQTRDTNIVTNSCVYDNKTGIISSFQQSIIKSPSHVLQTDGGFRYSLKSQQLEMFGNVSGSFEEKTAL